MADLGRRREGEKSIICRGAWDGAVEEVALQIGIRMKTWQRNVCRADTSAASDVGNEI